MRNKPLIDPAAICIQVPDSMRHRIEYLLWLAEQAETSHNHHGDPLAKMKLAYYLEGAAALIDMDLHLHDGNTSLEEAAARFQPRNRKSRLGSSNSGQAANTITKIS